MYYFKKNKRNNRNYINSFSDYNNCFINFSWNKHINAKPVIIAFYKGQEKQKKKMNYQV